MSRGSKVMMIIIIAFLLVALATGIVSCQIEKRSDEYIKHLDRFIANYEVRYGR